MHLPIRSNGRTHALVLLLCLGVPLVGACGGGSAAGAAAADRGESAPATTPANVFDTDLLVACDGIGYPGAAPYTTAPGVIHPVLVLEGESASMHARYGAVRDAWTRMWTQERPTALAEIELVACVQQTGERVTEECTGYQDDGVDTGNVVELMEVDYAISLREASTGREVAETSMTMLDDECPMFVSFPEGERTTRWRSFDADALSAFLEPHVIS